MAVVNSEEIKDFLVGNPLFDVPRLVHVFVHRASLALTSKVFFFFSLDIV